MVPDQVLHRLSHLPSLEDIFIYIVGSGFHSLFVCSEQIRMGVFSVARFVFFGRIHGLGYGRRDYCKCV